MSEREPGGALDGDTLKAGLLMESAQAHQRLAEAHLERLRAHTEDLDAVVRDEIRKTMVEELKGLMAEADRATRALGQMQRSVRRQGLWWNLLVALVCAVIPTTLARYALPSETEVSSLRAQRDQLQRNVDALAQRGARLDWRHCGEAARLCVRIDRKAPVYGESGDYYVVKGY